MTTKGVKTLSRKQETREKDVRPRGWVPPSNLEAPEPPEGFHHRWVRSEYRGMADEKNIIGRLRSGYELVKSDEYPDRMDFQLSLTENQRCNRYGRINFNAMSYRSKEDGMNTSVSNYKDNSNRKRSTQRRAPRNADLTR